MSNILVGCGHSLKQSSQEQQRCTSDRPLIYDITIQTAFLRGVFKLGKGRVVGEMRVLAEIMTKTSVLAVRLKTLLDGDGLKGKAARGRLWIGAGSGVEQGLRFVRNVILIRLLTTEDFGLMAIVLVVNTFFEIFTAIGVDAAIIQNPQSEEQTYLR